MKQKEIYELARKQLIEQKKNYVDDNGSINSIKRVGTLKEKLLNLEQEVKERKKQISLCYEYLNTLEVIDTKISFLTISLNNNDLLLNS